MRASVSSHNARRHLDRWAVDSGWSDFDTFISTGGSIMACRDDLLHRRESIDLMLAYLGEVAPPAQLPNHADKALRAAERQIVGEEISEPAAIQGAEA